MFSRLDILEAYYCFYRDFHKGQNSREYARLSRIQAKFKPSYNIREFGANALSRAGWHVYNRLLKTI